MTSPVEESFTDTSKPAHQPRRLNLQALFWACLVIGLIPYVLGSDTGCGPLFLISLGFMLSPAGKDASDRDYLQAVRSIGGVGTIALPLSYLTSLKNNPVSTWIQASIGAVLVVSMWVHWFRLSKVMYPSRGITL